MHHPGAIKVNNYQCKNHDVISLACFSSETQEMQAILFYFFFVRVRQKGVMIPGVPSGDRGNWE